ncbi:MAG: TlpA family protein disulfide reductase [Acidobacteriota bacterium]|nr:MAG: TlpA family protein disulfide reductase [Acidobacteriota bacterium]
MMPARTSHPRPAASVASALLLVAAWAFIPGCGLPASRCAQRSLDLVTGDVLPALTVRSLDDQPIDIHELIDGKIAVVDIWATWCGPCMAAIPRLQALHNRYADRGFTIVGLLTDRNASRIGPTIVERRGIGYPIVLDDFGEELNCAWGSPPAIPYMLLVDRDGAVVDIFRGTVGVAAVERRVELLFREESAQAARSSSRATSS